MVRLLRFPLAALLFGLLAVLGCSQKSNSSQNLPRSSDPAATQAEDDLESSDEDATKMPDSADAKLITDRKKFSDSVVIAPEKKEAGTIAVEAERGILLGAMKVTKLDTASGGGYVSTPNVDPDTDVIDDVEASMDILRYKFNVTEAGDYRVFAKMSAPTEDDDAIFVTVDRGVTFLELEAPLTADNQFVWVEVNPIEDAVPLAAGEYTVDFRRLEAGLKIDALAITKNPAFTGTDVITVEAVRALQFDIGKICNTSSATLEVEVAQLNGNYSFKNLKVISEKPLAVKAIGFGINGLINPAFSTFMSVDTEVAANQTSPLSTSELIVPIAKGQDVDDFSLSFERCSEP